MISLQSKGLSESFPALQFERISSSAFFMVELSHTYMTTEKPISLTIHTFVGKVMSLIFNNQGLESAKENLCKHYILPVLCSIIMSGHSTESKVLI